MSVNFSNRSAQAELIDAPGVPEDLLFQNLHELDVLNRRLGGHDITLTGIKELVTNSNGECHIVDLGCGSGDTLKYIAMWGRKKKYKLKLTGVDASTKAIDYLRKQCSELPEITGEAADYRTYLNKTKNIDIIVCSLFCHHLTPKELEELLVYIKNHVNIGLVINDLRRSRLAYYSAIIFTRLFNGSILARNDGPVSVLRGFKQHEFEGMLQKTGWKNYSIQRKLGFRFLVVGRNT